MSTSRLFLILTFGASLVGILLALLTLPWVPEDLKNVIALLAGLVTMPVLSLMKTAAFSPSLEKVVLEFDEERSQKALDAAIPAEFEAVNEKGTRKGHRDAFSTSLVDQDPVLALAKLRIDIERELRDLADSYGVPGASSPGRLANKLVEAGRLSPDVRWVLEDILPICNKAIHGAVVSTDLARSVVRVGEELTSYLRSENRRRARRAPDI